MSQPMPSPEAMRAARDLLDQFSISYLGEPTAAKTECIAAAIDDAFRPLRESHERLRVACHELVTAGVEAALACRIYQCETPAKRWDTALQEFSAALSQVPR